MWYRRQYYQDAYSVLILMFGSAAMLHLEQSAGQKLKYLPIQSISKYVPRPNFQLRSLLNSCDELICKVYLYNNEHSLAFAQQNARMRRFGEFLRGWGINEQTFEFRSWMARQHRVFAELLEQGSRSTPTIPTRIPQSSSIQACCSTRVCAS